MAAILVSLLSSLSLSSRQLDSRSSAPSRLLLCSSANTRPYAAQVGRDQTEEETHQVLDRVRGSVGADGIEGREEVRDDQLVQVLLAGQTVGVRHALRLLHTQHYGITLHYNLCQSSEVKTEDKFNV